MKTYTSRLLFAVGLLVFGSPFFVLAHERYTYQIGGQTYQIVVGSLNEPLIVDDKSGLDLTVTRGGGTVTMSADGDLDGAPASSVPVTGLEQTVKVEMIAGGAKKMMDISPVYGKSGGYKTSFFPTVQTTFSYRIFGTINDTQVDLTFTCNPAGNPQVQDDNSPVKVSDNVTRLSKTGAFGCAEAKADFGFPEKAPSSYDLANMVANVEKTASSASLLSWIGIILGIIALIFGIKSIIRK